MIRQIYLEVEENGNCEYMPLQLFEGHAEPVPIERVRMQDFVHAEAVYEVTGWDSGGDLDGSGEPVPAIYIPVSDSGQGRAYLVYGGDFGIRFRPSDSAVEWSLEDPDQWGEPYVVLTDANDLLLDA